jgi:hypothetical protein
LRISKGPRWLAKALAGASCLVVTAALSGCQKKVKAEFERPPAVTNIPDNPESTSEEPDKDLEALEKASEPVEAPTPVAEEPAPQPVPRPRATPPPEPPPPEPAEPRLTINEDSQEARSIVEKLTRAEAILSTLEKRPLTKEQREQLGAARAFVIQARKAYSEKDYRRAAVLADKGLILAEDVRSSTGSS